MRNGSLLTFLICLICFNAQSQQILSVGSKSISYNSYAELDINLQNSSKVSAIQFDINASLTNIIFPSVSDSIVNTNRFDGHSISYSKISETQIRIIIFSLSNKNLIGVSGKLLGLKVRSNTIPGANNLVLSNITIADSTGLSLAPTAQTGIITVTAPQINVTDTVRLGNIPMLTNTSNYLYFNNNGNDTLKISSISSSNSELTFNSLSLPITLQQYQGYNLNYIINPLVKGNKVYPIKIISNDPSGDKYVYIKDSAYAVNKIYFTSAVSGSYNTEADVSISIKNHENYSAFQLSITLPDGIDYVANSVALDNSRKQDHSISANVVNGVLTIIAYSASLKNFLLNDGQVFTFKLKLNKPGGTYTLPISNASITNVQAQNIISDYVAGTVTIKSPSISLNNSSLYFGRISTKEYAQTGLSINNNGTENLIIYKIIYPSTAINSSVALPLTIAPGVNQSVIFGFHSQLPVDLNSSLVTIQSNDPLGDKTVSVNASAYSKNELYLKTPYLHHNGGIRIPVMLTNYDSLKGVQFDIQINSPTKVSFNDTLFVLSDRFKKFSASYQKLDDQNLRVILFSLDASIMLPDSAYVGELLLNIVANQPDGNYGYVDFANVVLGGNNGLNLFSGKVGQNIYLCNGSINLNDSGTVNFCDQITLQANSGNASVWYKNDTLISNYTGSTYIVNSSGSWKSVISNGNCNYISNTVQTVKTSAPPIPEITNSKPLSFCTGDSTVLTSSSSSNNQWLLNGVVLTGDTLRTKTVKESGIYTVQINNGGGCTSTSLKDTVVVNTLPATPIISNSRPLVFCVGDSTLLTSSLASGNQWYLNDTIINSAVDTSILIMTSGKYSITNTNASGCSAKSANIIISTNPLPAVPTLSNSRPLSFCSSDSTVLSSSSNSNNQWYLNGVSLTGANQTTYTAKASGIYTVQNSNSFGCTSTSLRDTIVVNALPATPIISNSRPLVFCVGDSTLLTSSLTGGNQWYLNDTIINSAVNTSILVTASGKYSVTNTNASGCSAKSANTIISTNPLPAVPTLSNSRPLSFCSSDSTVLSSSSNSNNQWYLNGVSITGANQTTYTAKASGIYTVQNVNGSGCTATSTGTTVTSNALPNVPVITNTGSLTFNSGDSIKLSSSSATGNQWYLNGLQMTGANSQDLIVKSGGSYSVNVVNASGCSSNSISITVIVNTNSSTPVISILRPLTFCVGDSTILSSSSSSGNQWSLNGSPLTGATSQTLVVKTSGSYSVVSSNSASSVAVIVIANLNPSVPIISNSKPLIFCVGDSTILLSSIATANQWYQNGLKINGALNNQLHVDSSGIYSIQTTNEFGCKSVSLSVSVLVNYLPALPVISNSKPLAFFAGDSAILTSSILNGNQWLLNGLPISGAYLQSLVVKTAGNYSVKVTNTSGCSTNSISVVVTVSSSNGAPLISNNRPLNFCNGDSTILTSSIDNGNQWYLNGAIISNETSKTLAVKNAGAYSVLNNGRQSTSITVIVNALPSTPTISNSRPLTFIVGDSTILSSSSSNTYQWILNDIPISGATSSNLTVKIGGAYKITVSNISGCTAISNSVKVTVNSAAVPVISNNRPLTFCTGDSTTLSSSYASGNQWLLNGAVVVGENAKTIVVKSSGNYSVIVNVNGNNISSASVTIVANSIPAKPTIVRDINSNLVSSASSGYQWYTDTTVVLVGENSKYYKPTTNGYYTVRTNLNGCLSSFSDRYYFLVTAIINYGLNNQIKVYPNPAKDIIIISHNFSAFEKVQLELLDIAGRILILKSNLKNFEQINISNLSSGLYSIKFYGKNGLVLGSSKIIKL